MTPVAVFDLVALLGFLSAIGIAVASRKGSGKIPALAGLLIMLAMVAMVFVSFSNLLEGLGITSSLDQAEDLADLLLFPLVAYSLYVVYASEQMDELKAAIGASKAEHSMLMSIVDSSPIAIVVVDDIGCATFANRYAWDTLELGECSGPT